MTHESKGKLRVARNKDDDFLTTEKLLRSVWLFNEIATLLYNLREIEIYPELRSDFVDILVRTAQEAERLEFLCSPTQSSLVQ